MRRVLALTLCGALGAPVGAWAQPGPVVPQAPWNVPAAPSDDDSDDDALSAEPPAATALQAAPTPSDPASNTDGPVSVESGKKKKQLITKGRIGGAMGSVIGGVAGAALLGPVGKFVGGFAGKGVAKAMMGKKKDAAPEQQVAEAPSAETAASPAVASPATAPPLPAPALPAADKAPPAAAPPSQPVAVNETPPDAGEPPLEPERAPDAPD